MNPHSFKQSQFELFPEARDADILQRPKPRFFSGSLNLSGENMVILGIGVIVSMVLSFSLGVERGKKVVRSVHSPISETSTTLNPAPASSSESGKKTVPVASEGSANEPGVQGASAAQEGSGVLAEAVPEALEKNIDKQYTVQVASFKREDQAQRLATSLQKNGYDMTMVVPKGSYSIVCVGKFSKHSEAKSFSRKLKKQYKDLLVRSL